MESFLSCMESLEQRLEALLEPIAGKRIRLTADP